MLDKLSKIALRSSGKTLFPVPNGRFPPAFSVKVEKYTLGIGDRFAHQGRAQLQAILNAREAGIDVHPVWNKSNREHLIIKSRSDDSGPRPTQR
jgi:hypothetical protein